MYFPIFIDLSKKKLLIVGAGHIAARRIRVLYEFAGNMTIVSPEISPEIDLLAEAEALQVNRRRFCTEDVEGYDLVFAATDNEMLNRQIYDICHEKGIPVNVCSDQSLCDFFFPSIISDGEVVIGINASGQDHGKVKQTRKLIENALGVELQKSKYDS